MGRRLLVLVDEGAVLPDLALGAGLDVDGAHLHHGAREDLEEHLGRRVHHAEDVGLEAASVMSAASDWNRPRRLSTPR